MYSGQKKNDVIKLLLTISATQFAYANLTVIYTGQVIYILIDKTIRFLDIRVLKVILEMYSLRFILVQVSG